jgi:hypothetical protein
MAALTLLHVAISLVAIVAGVPVVRGLLAARTADGWTPLFLATTILTNVTGYLFFPLRPILPSHIVGAISLVLLAIAVTAFYPRQLAGPWRWGYAVAATAALYLNVFVLVVQSFLRVPALNALAPTQTEPPFAVAQGCVLVFFVALATAAVRRFHPHRLPAPREAVRV